MSEQGTTNSMVICGSVFGVRTFTRAPSTLRRRCPCGCRGRTTHYGLGDGVALTHGCELSIRRWVRDGIKAHGGVSS